MSVAILAHASVAQVVLAHGHCGVQIDEFALETTSAAPCTSARAKTPAHAGGLFWIGSVGRSSARVRVGREAGGHPS